MRATSRRQSQFNIFTYLLGAVAGDFARSVKDPYDETTAQKLVAYLFRAVRSNEYLTQSLQEQIEKGPLIPAAARGFAYQHQSAVDCDNMIYWITQLMEKAWLSHSIHNRMLLLRDLFTEQFESVSHASGTLFRNMCRYLTVCLGLIVTGLPNDGLEQIDTATLRLLLEMCDGAMNMLPNRRYDGHITGFNLEDRVLPFVVNLVSQPAIGLQAPAVEYIERMIRYTHDGIMVVNIGSYDLTIVRIIYLLELVTYIQNHQDIFLFVDLLAATLFVYIIKVPRLGITSQYLLPLEQCCERLISVTSQELLISRICHYLCKVHVNPEILADVMNAIVDRQLTESTKSSGRISVYSCIRYISSVQTCVQLLLRAPAGSKIKTLALAVDQQLKTSANTSQWLQQETPSGLCTICHDGVNPTNSRVSHVEAVGTSFVVTFDQKSCTVCKLGCGHILHTKCAFGPNGVVKRCPYCRSSTNLKPYEHELRSL